MNDPIVDEVRRVRDALAARFHYDLDAIFQDIKEREKQSGLQFVQGVAHPPSSTPSTPPAANIAPHVAKPLDARATELDR